MMNCDYYCYELTMFIVLIYGVSLGRFYLRDIHCDYLEPFMWCRIDARLWHVYYLFTYKPFMWCR